MSVIFSATSDGRFFGAGLAFQCAVGKAGIVPAEDKREGDHASPAGVWPMRRVYYRSDRVAAPKTALPLAPLTEEDGWCDAPSHPLYNRRVKLPFEASHEKLWRADHVYDLIVELGYNDDPPRPGKGSAIFMHIAKPDYSGTEGCVALAEADLREVLMLCDPEASFVRFEKR